MIDIVVVTQDRKDSLQRLFSDMFWGSLNPALLYDNYPRLIVLDQGSNRETQQYVENFQPEADVLYMPIISEYNYGCGGGRQKVIDRLIGGMLQADDIVIFLDDDVEVELASWLHHMLKPLYDPTLSADIVGCEGMEIGSNGNTYPAVWTPGYVEYVSGGWSAYRGSLFLDGLSFDPQFNPNYWEDVDLCFSARMRGSRVYSTGYIGLKHASLSDVQKRKELYLHHKMLFQAKWKDRFPEHKVNTYYAQFASMEKQKP